MTKIKKIAIITLISVISPTFNSCSQGQMDQAALSGVLPLIGTAAGGIIGSQSGNTGQGALIGGAAGLLLQESIKSSYYQRQYAQERAWKAQKSTSFQKTYASKKSSTGAKKVAIRVPKDKSVPESQEGFMIYDPERRSFDNEKVYPSTSSSNNGDLVSLGGTKAVVYGY
jgi:hypothetical protein